MDKGFRTVYSDTKCKSVPVADEGIVESLVSTSNGIVESLVSTSNGIFVKTEVIGTLREKVDATYGILDEGSTVVNEKVSASGLED